jgi:hypothetical protein
VWESKTATLDGGKLPDTFGKDPKMVAAEKRGPKSPPHKETPDVDAGPRQEGPVASKKKSVVEMKAAFDTMAEKEKREIEKREAEKRSREEASTFLRVKSGNSDSTSLPRGKSGADGTQLSGGRGGMSDEEKAAIAATVNTLEAQAKELTETVARLRRDLRA